MPAVRAGVMIIWVFAFDSGDDALNLIPDSVCKLLETWRRERKRMKRID